LFNCPAILGRIDENPEDIRFLTTANSGLIETNIVQDGTNTARNYSKVSQQPFTTTGGDSAVTPIGSHIYLSDGSYVGKIVDMYNDFNTDYYLIFDKIRTTIPSGAEFYRASSKYHGLYLLNTQGLSSGGFLQMLNSMLSANGKVTQFSNNLLTNSSNADIDGDIINSFGTSSWRFFDLQKSNPGSLSYRQIKWSDGKYKDYYCQNDGNLGAYALGYQYKAGISTAVVSTNAFSNQIPPNHGILPATLSNFKDEEHSFSSSEGWALLPKTLEDSKWGYDWVNDTNRDRREGKIFNPIQRMKEHWELIDPKTIRYYIFGPSDIYPESFSRQHHLAYQERDLTDYNLMLKNEEVLEKTGIKHTNYLGTLPRAKTTDDSYETIQINEASIKSNEMKRFGLMRLIECTFDWHFNMTDPELPPSKDQLLPTNKVTKYTETVTSSHTIASTTTATPGVITLDATTNFRPLDRVFTSGGKYIGQIASTRITVGSVNTSTNVITSSSHGLTTGDKIIFSTQTHANRIQPLVGGALVYAIRDNANEFKVAASSSDASSGTAISLSAAGSGNRYFYRFDKITSTTIELTGKAEYVGTNGALYTGVAYRMPEFNGVSKTHEWFNDDANYKLAYVEHNIHGSADKSTICEIIDSYGSHMLKGYVLNQSNDFSDTQLSSHFDFSEGVEGESASDLNSDGYTEAGQPLPYDNVVLPIHGEVKVTSGRQSIMDKNYYDSTSTTTYTDLALPSYVLQSIADAPTTGAITPNANRLLYGSMKGLILDRFIFEDKDYFSAAKGMVTDNFDGFTRRMDSVSGGNKFSFLTLKCDDLAFAEYKPTASSASGLNATSTAADKIKGDGTYITLKPLLKLDTNLADLTIQDKNLSHGNSTTSDANYPNSYMVSITLDDDVSVNQWLRYSPNLQGCYLVSQAGIIWDTAIDTYASTDVEQCTATDIIPERILYVISHTVTGSHSSQIHHLVLDNIPSHQQHDSSLSGGDYNYFRVMRPAETCIWPFQKDNNIDLYRLTSKYTKMAYENKTYGQIPSWAYQGEQAGNEQHIFTSRTTGNTTVGWNEAALSMYVIIDPDAQNYTSTNNTTKRNTGHLVLRKYATLFGTGKTYANGNNYDMLLNDGNNTFRTTISPEAYYSNDIDASASDLTNYCTLKFSNLDKIPKMNGIVSLGEIFTVKSRSKVNLNNVKTAHIGTTVTICDEAEKAAENIFKDNSLEFSNESVEFPYFSATNLQGIDAHAAVNYLLNYKNKELVLDKGDFEIVKSNSNLEETDIEIKEENTDIKLIEVSQEESSFDFYNEITVYGNKVKGTKRNSSSIRDVGRKTLEEFDESLTTQTEVDKRARELLTLHTKGTKKYGLKLFDTGLEWIKAGDVISINYPKEHIPYGHYKVMQVKHTTTGFIELEVGLYSKGLEDRLADLFIQNKKTNAHLRGDKFKTPAKEEEYLSTLKIKPIKLIVKRTYVGGSQLIGFNTTFGFSTVFGFSATGSSGSTTETVLEKELI